MSLLGLHSLAQGGDGLLSPLVDRLVERRLLEADPAVVDFRQYNPAVPHGAGTTPLPPPSVRTGRGSIRTIRTKG